MADIPIRPTDDFDQAMDGLSAIFLGAYLIVVFARGNIKALFTELKQETGFLEFLVAAFILYKLFEITPIKPIVGLFITGAVLVALLNSAQSLNLDLFKQYGRGSISLFTLLTGAFSA